MIPPLASCVDRANEYRSGERAALFEKIEGAMQATSAELDKEGRTLRLQCEHSLPELFATAHRRLPRLHCLTQQLALLLCVLWREIGMR